MDKYMNVTYLFDLFLFFLTDDVTHKLSDNG